VLFQQGRNVLKLLNLSEKLGFYAIFSQIFGKASPEERDEDKELHLDLQARKVI